MDLISDGIYNLIIFVLAIYVGYHVVWNCLLYTSDAADE